MEQKIELTTLNSPKTQKEQEDKPLIYDRVIDGAYLVSSLLGYFSSVSGDSFSLSADDLILDLSAVALAGGISGATVLYKPLQRYRETLREALSGLKNGRHATVNALTVYSMFSHIPMDFTLFTPAGAIAFTIGLLLMIANSFRLQYEREQEAHIEFLTAALQNPEYASLDEIKKHAPSALHQYRLNGLQVFHGVTDGLYCAGNILRLFGLFCLLGHPISAGIVITSLIAAAFIAITVMSTVYYLTNSQLQDLEHQRLYAQVTQNHESLNKIACTEEKFKESLQYKLYSRIQKLFERSREAVNFVKNSGDASDNIAAMATGKTLAQATQLTDLNWIGFFVAIPSLLYMTYRRWEAPQPAKPEPELATPIRQNLLHSDQIHMTQNWVNT